MDKNEKTRTSDGLQIVSDILEGIVIAAAICSSNDRSSRSSRIGRDSLDKRENRNPEIDVEVEYRIIRKSNRFSSYALANAMANAGVNEVGVDKHMEEDTFFYISENSDIFGMFSVRFNNKYHIGVAHVRRFSSIFNSFDVDLYELGGSKIRTVRINPTNEAEIQWLSRSARTAIEKSQESRGYPSSPSIDR